jgi:hypothetical protein
MPTDSEPARTSRRRTTQDERPWEPPPEVCRGGFVVNTKGLRCARTGLTDRHHAAGRAVQAGTDAVVGASGKPTLPEAPDFVVLYLGAERTLDALSATRRGAQAAVIRSVNFVVVSGILDGSRAVGR